MLWSAAIAPKAFKVDAASMEEDKFITEKNRH